MRTRRLTSNPRQEVGPGVILAAPNSATGSGPRTDFVAEMGAGAHGRVANAKAGPVHQSRVSEISKAVASPLVIWAVLSVKFMTK